MLEIVLPEFADRFVKRAADEKNACFMAGSIRPCRWIIKIMIDIL